jgi:nucleoside-diphosphate-sugar epimerase
MKREYNVLIIGGSGFIGSYIVEECLRRNFNVTVLCRSGSGTKACQYLQADLLELSTDDFKKIIKDFDKIIYAAGVDERVKPEGDPYEFYARHNIEPCIKLFRAIQQSSITHVVLLNSIFSMLDRQKPELELAKKHDYIRSRVDQNQHCHELAENHTVLTTLEVPWVFGSPEKGKSQWEALILYARSASPLMCCRGGASIISAISLAQACVSAIEKPEASSTLPVAEKYLSYKELLLHICQFAGRTHPRILDIKDEVFVDLLNAGASLKDLFGLKSGLNTHYVAELLMEEIIVDTSYATRMLDYQTDLVMGELQKLVESIHESFPSLAWRKTLNFFRS